jgi:translocation protein SEC63
MSIPAANIGYGFAAWWYIVSRLMKVYFVKNDEIGAVARTEVEKQKAEGLKREKGLKSIMTTFFQANLVFTICATILFVWLLYTVMQDGEVNSFDPFSILEIDPGSDSKAIKKAFRSLSLKYHPDKNPGDRIAAAKFMMVSKAYESLTDPVARENFEKYGNPDGKQSLAISIGLPSFLLETKNRNLVLVFYLIVMVGVIPYCVYSYYSDSSKYGEKSVMYDSYAWYYHCINEHSLVKTLPEVLAGSAEFRQRNALKDPAEKQALAQLMTSVRSQMAKPKYNHPVCVKGNVLMHTHLLRRTDLLNKEMMQDLNYMLQQSTSLIDAMISVCKNQDALSTAATCIEFGQYVTQAMWVKDSPLLQIPHFTPEEIKHVLKGKVPVKTVQEYREIPDDQKKGMVNFTETQKQDVFSFLKLFPDISVETRVFVDDDEDDNVYEGDLCTVEVKITRNHLAEGEKAGLVYAPYFPYPKKDAFWVILGQKEQGKIISIEKIGDPRKVVTHRIKFMAPPVGKYEFDLLVKSNAYVGMDELSKVHLETKDNSALPEYKVHPDDAELDDEPTLFEEMLGANIEQDSDDEDSDEEEEVDDAQESNKRKAMLRKARHEEDSDEDDDAEEVYADK